MARLSGRASATVVTRYTVTRPDGSAWTRTFGREAAAWRVLAPGLAGAAFRARRAQMVRAGWRVAPGASAEAARA